MLISDDFIFLHVPRTGGTSIRQSLARLNGVKTIKLNYHSGIDEAILFLGEEEFKKRWSFGFIRNPFDWLVSVYFLGQRFVDYGDQEEKFKKISRINFKKGMGFEEFVIDNEVTPLSFLRNEKFKDSRQFVDKIFRLEDLQLIIKGDFDGRIKGFNAIKKHNSSEHSPYQGYYSEELKEVVYEKFRREFDFGNYSF